MLRLCSCLLLIPLAGCGWAINMKPRGVDPAALSATEKAEVEERFRQDRAVCWEKGAAYQTYSGGSYFYEGTGGGSGRSQFNRSVYITCMEARGYDYVGRSPTFFGMKAGNLPW